MDVRAALGPVVPGDVNDRPPGLAARCRSAHHDVVVTAIRRARFIRPPRLRERQHEVMGRADRLGRRDCESRNSELRARGNALGGERDC